MKSFKLLFALLILFNNVFAQEEKIDDKLKLAMLSADSTEFFDIIIELREQVNFADRHLTRFQVLSELMNLAETSQALVRQLLEQERLAGNVASFKTYYVFNGVSVRCKKAIIAKLVLLPAISKVYLDEQIFLESLPSDSVMKHMPSVGPLKSNVSSGYWWNIAKIGAHKVRDYIQIDGEGILVGVIDNGFSATHPDLSPRWKSVYGWKDFSTGSPTPFDDALDGHGTWVTGIIVAGNSSGNDIGVAPGAQFIAAKAFSMGGGTGTSTLSAMQWMLDPDDDGNPSTGQEHVPHVVNNSWNGGTTYSYWRTAVSNWVAAGIFPVFSAGNTQVFPAPPSSVQSPADYPESFGVGYVNDADLIGDYSGRGPVIWPPDPPLVKPDVVAPSLPDIKVCQPTTGYAIKNGKTSTAAPHVTGAIALIKQAAPSLTIQDLRTVLEAGAKDLGVTGKDNDYGAGRIDVYQSVLLAHAYSNKSLSSTATASNNGRRMVKTSDNRYHLVFESGVASGGNVLSEILYRRSNSGGTSWETPTRLSAGDEQNRYPSIVERIDGTTKKLYAVWQRKTGTNTYDLFLRHFNGSIWENSYKINGMTAISSSNDPLPAIAISTPSASFEMMVVYRTSSGLKTRRSTSINGTSWESEITVTTSTSARNPNVTYSSNDYANFDAAWDNGSQVYHRHFYGGNWSSEVNVSSGLSTANTHEYPSYARGSTNNRHIVWQATDQTQGNRKIIFHSYNLNTTTYTKFYSSSVNYLRPNIAGIGSGGAFVLWHDDSGAKNIRYARFNGSYWETSSAGVVYANNGIDASVATMNPPGTSIKGVYRSAGSSPYSLSLGGYLNKPDAPEEITYSRQILFGQNEGAVLALRIVAPMIDDEVVPLTFPEVTWDDSLTAETVIDKLTFDFIVPANAEALQFGTEIYANNAGQLLEEDKTALELYFELIDHATDASLETSTRELVSLPDEIKSTKTAEIALANHRGVAVRLRPVLAGLDFNKARGALVHVYGDDDFGQRDATKPKISAGTNVSRLSISARPNPFNPSTQIHFTLPSTGLATLRIFDVNGRLVREWSAKQFSAGEHVVLWDGRDQAGREAASGVYFSQIVFGNEHQITRMTLMR